MDKMDCNNPFRKTVFLQMKLIVHTKARDQGQSLEYQPPQQQMYQPKPHQPTNCNSAQKKVEKVQEPLPESFKAANPFKEIDNELKKAGLADENAHQNRPCLGIPIVPQNPIMAVRSLKGVTVGEFIVTNNPNGGFIASVSINSKVYKGHGRSKKAAKNNACEKAICDYLQEKARNKGSSKMLLNDSNANFSTSKGVVRMDRSAGNNMDETMVDLAAFALYKLLTEWKNEGFIIPERQLPVHAENISNNEKPIVCSDLPPNWEAMHPAAVLCCMGHIFSYIDKGFSWAPTDSNLRRTFGINVGGKDFVGSGSSIKAARRNVTAMACNALYNTNFELIAPQNP